MKNINDSKIILKEVNNNMENKELLEILEEKFSKIDQKFDKIDQRFDKMDQRFDKMDQRMDIKLKQLE